jgi:hypothetical protein
MQKLWNILGEKKNERIADGAAESTLNASFLLPVDFPIICPK